MKRLTLALCSLAALGLILGIGACKKEQPAPPTEEKKEEVKTEEKKEEPKAEEPKAEEKKDEEQKDEAAAATGDKIGVAVCDDYLEKYEKCVSGKVPEAARAQMKTAMDATRTAWKKAAETDAGKQGLEKACQMALDVAKKNMAHFKCEW